MIPSPAPAAARTALREVAVSFSRESRAAVTRCVRACVRACVRIWYQAIRPLPWDTDAILVQPAQPGCQSKPRLRASPTAPSPGRPQGSPLRQSRDSAQWRCRSRFPSASETPTPPFPSAGRGAGGLGLRAVATTTACRCYRHRAAGRWRAMRLGLSSKRKRAPRSSRIAPTPGRPQGSPLRRSGDVEVVPGVAHTSKPGTGPSALPKV